MTTVASHGDFANRRLKSNNTEVLNDQQLRESCGIECETYDRSLLQNFDIYISDRPHPQYYHPDFSLRRDWTVREDLLAKKHSYHHQCASLSNPLALRPIKQRI